ncbi:hypothetical protein [Williamsia deligens]|uniref:Asp23/Gls24 family envelope stress response protein n=1 Tax=Williamsia deligens TaxID=321325 RepID=A0ABW3G5M6_9NOCA|nr:hypothetical protein [Williamsia deligens]MCP2193610.1 hypothetical protein [Williamsia deligens]
MTSDAELADAVATAAASVPGVTGLNAGRFGEVATYSTKGRVVGVRLHDHSGEVHIEVTLDRGVMDTAEDVRRAVEAVAGRPMTVVVEDVSVDGDQPAVDEPTAPPAAEVSASPAGAADPGV